MHKTTFALFLACLAITACTRSAAMRTSQDTAIIQTSAAPICGATGAAKVAQYQAAIETIKAGFDRYMIVDAANSSDVQVAQLPGTYHTTGTITDNGPYSTLNASTSYTPGATIVVGTHNQGLAIRMFKESQPGSEQAISARQILGPKWAAIVKSGVHTCAD